MATRLEEIITRARDTLSDPNGERWSDARLIRLADDAQKLIAKHAKSLRSKVDVPLAALTAEYALPDAIPGAVTVWTAAGGAVQLTALPGALSYALPPSINRITRALNELGAPIPVLTHDQADKLYGSAWEALVQSPMQALIFDKNDQSRLKVYPIPVETTPTEISTEIGNLNSLYGITVAGGLESTYDVMSSPFGVVVGVAQITSTSFTLYFVRAPNPLLVITDNIELNQMYDMAMKFYIAGMALLDDNDAQSRSRGAEEIGFFNAELKGAKTDSSRDNMAGGDVYNTPYVGGFQ